MNILFGTGYSPHAATYFQYIQQLAYKLGASITVLHVYERPILLSEQREDFDDLPYPEQIRLRDEWVHSVEVFKIQSFIQKYRNEAYGNLQINDLVIAGDADTIILNTLSEGNYDMLVLGMRKHNFQERLLGNLVFRLIDELSTPLLLIPPNVVNRPIQEIVYATAFEVGEEYAVRLMIEWGKELKANLTLAHVVAEQKNITIARRKLSALKGLFESAEGSGRLSSRLLHGEVKTALKEYVNRSTTDIVAIHHRKRGLWETLISKNMAKELAENLSIPLLVLKDPNKEL